MLPGVGEGRGGQQGKKVCKPVRERFRFASSNPTSTWGEEDLAPLCVCLSGWLFQRVPAEHSVGRNLPLRCSSFFVRSRRRRSSRAPYRRTRTAQRAHRCVGRCPSRRCRRLRSRLRHRPWRVRRRSSRTRGWGVAGAIYADSRGTTSRGGHRTSSFLSPHLFAEVSLADPLLFSVCRCNDYTAAFRWGATGTAARPALGRRSRYIPGTLLSKSELT